MSLLPYWLLANRLIHLKLPRIHQLLSVFTTIKELFEADVSELQTLGLTSAECQELKNPNWQAIAADLKWAEQAHHHLICFDEDAYPLLLKQIVNPPLVLYVQGNKLNLTNSQIAMVGSRHPTPTGLMNAKQFAIDLAQAGLTITSGLALGIDAASHQGALQAEGMTIAVMGTGLNRYYPQSHTRLALQILEKGGSIISEFSLDTPPFPSNFPRRNRIISGLSTGVLVIEATLKSGSLITARYALEQGREVFALPGSIHQPQTRGCHLLIRQGAYLVEKSADVLQEIGLNPVSSANLKQNKRALSPEENRVFHTIEYEITALDMIILRSALTAGKVSSILLSLELAGLIQAVPGGYIREIG